MKDEISRLSFRVRDISASKCFLEKVLHQKAIMDIGKHVAFEGISLQQGYAKLVGVAANSVRICHLL